MAGRRDVRAHGRAKRDRNPRRPRRPPATGGGPPVRVRASGTADGDAVRVDVERLRPGSRPNSRSKKHRRKCDERETTRALHGRWAPHGRGEEATYGRCGARAKTEKESNRRTEEGRRGQSVHPSPERGSKRPRRTPCRPTPGTPGGPPCPVFNKDIIRSCAPLPRAPVRGQESPYAPRLPLPLLVKELTGDRRLGQS